MAPVGVPFTNHCRTGVDPGFPKLAVKVTGIPSQTEVAGVLIDMDAVCGWRTDMVIELEFTGLISGQVTPEVSTHVTTSALAGK